MKAPDSDQANAIAVMVLGAGRSQRFKGGDKLDQFLLGKPVAHYVLAALRGFHWGRKIVVCRSKPAWMQAYVDDGFVRAEIDNADAGMAGSIHRGLSEITTQPWVMICLADMPLISRGHIEELLAAFSANRAATVATKAASGFCPPAIFPRALLGKLPKTGDDGAKALLGDAHGPVAADSMMRDIDTIADLQMAAQYLRLIGP
ncbi:NTP transferase domain-containing protein [Ochrobactrum quorumnocens]|uniref:NTP transferase domain-containing protein n=1 Tax=Ochrobactrum quorumnocens TaxID=271865 RepID=A0A5N1JVU6_9HYPH|nr:NTP transferase domain-containing protein [[Ochrobactrum] quorumnocens]KAA9368257.1 NTP transferase domain-containing protein [[Ochrobactrum] quorumnocens]MBD7991844.1 NTP transferase domain-containing protein [Ochrobactrum gallinarum]